MEETLRGDIAALIHVLLREHQKGAEATFHAKAGPLLRAMKMLLEAK